VLADGTSADRQRAVVARGGELADVVDLVVAETRARPVVDGNGARNHVPGTVRGRARGVARAAGSGRLPEVVLELPEVVAP
jgi:hypothetical protein